MVQLSENEGIEGRTFVVTGGAGHVGSLLCLELARRGAAEVRSFDLCNSQERLALLKDHGVTCIVGESWATRFFKFVVRSWFRVFCSVFCVYLRGGLNCGMARPIAQVYVILQLLAIDVTMGLLFCGTELLNPWLDCSNCWITSPW